MATKVKVQKNMYSPKPHVKRKGVHSKTKTSITKGSALYKKPNVGQG